MDSILTSVKKLLGGLTEEDTAFDTDIILCINAVLMGLCQLGVGPSTGFSISDKTTTWEDYLGEDSNLEAVKTYVGFKVKMMFDPPTNSIVAESIRKEIDEQEFRIKLSVDR